MATQVYPGWFLYCIIIGANRQLYNFINSYHMATSAYCVNVCYHRDNQQSVIHNQVQNPNYKAPVLMLVNYMCNLC